MAGPVSGTSDNFFSKCSSIHANPVRRPNSGSVPAGGVPALRLKQEVFMRIMFIVTSPKPDQGPTPALMEAMGKLAEREIKAGRMIDTGGLMPIAMTGAQVKITNGK